jgi:sugar phosphate isomerase/epimerase
MDIALSTISLPSHSWRDCLAEASRAGYANVELMMIPGFAQATLGLIRPEELRTEASRNGVSIVSLHGGALDGLSEATIQHTQDYVSRLISFARDAGVPLVNVNGGYIPPGVGLGQGERSRFIRRIAGALRILEPVAAAAGLRLTLENHFGFQLQGAGDYEELLAQAPAGETIGITLDTGHFTAAEVDMPAFIGRFGRRVTHVHIKDHVGKRSTPLGEGRTDNRAVVLALAAQGYDGCLSVELEVHDNREVEHVRAARGYMDALLRACNLIT